MLFGLVDKSECVLESFVKIPCVGMLYEVNDKKFTHVHPGFTNLPVLCQNWLIDYLDAENDGLFNLI